jgi:hypothetical protein
VEKGGREGVVSRAGEWEATRSRPFPMEQAIGGAEARVMVRVGEQRLIGGWGGQVRDL